MKNPKPLNIERNQSSLSIDCNERLPLRIIQATSELALIGKRVLPGTPLKESPQDPQVKSCSELLSKVNKGALTVISYHPGMGGCHAQLKNASQKGAVVTLAGVDADRQRNISYIACNGHLLLQEKLSLSSEDEIECIQGGDKLYIFGTANTDLRSPVLWGVLNCHDYTHVEIVETLLRERIELLVVVSHNPATRLYWQYALSDVHRLFCYIVIVNTAELGGSAVFAPFRRLGKEKNAQYGAGGQIFGAKGPAALDTEICLEIKLLRELREDFKSNGFSRTKGFDSKFALEAMVPSQHFMNTGDGVPIGSPSIKDVHDIECNWGGETVRIAVAQLQHMKLEEYLKTGYRLGNADGIDVFSNQLEHWLEHVKNRCEYLPKNNNRALDLLVFPEVFIPRKLLPKLQKFSNETGATVIAGVDYPAGNANECAILLPYDEIRYYRKVTRSQYDGIAHDGNGRMKMERGGDLIRLIDKDSKRSLGVLICYDFSHFDLVYKLNLHNREMPLDMVVISAHNPFSELYRSSCIADAHRFYQYVVMCNVAEYGGSGVFGPVRSPGARQVLAEAGKGVEAIILKDVNLAGLAKAKNIANEQSLLENEFQRRPGILRGRLAVPTTSPELSRDSPATATVDAAAHSRGI